MTLDKNTDQKAAANPLNRPFSSADAARSTSILSLEQKSIGASLTEPYAPQNKLLWDFWVYREQQTYHLFHLQAPATLEPQARHRASTVGHAVSNDLISWSDRGTVLTASEDPKAWDSVSVWTGCTIKKGDTYFMFYTSRSRQDTLSDGYVGHTQRIGVALSKDLQHWVKYSNNPILEADPQFYEQQEQAYNKHQGCRDPFVLYDDKSSSYYMFFTARAKSGEQRARGCIGKARSKDLLNWEMLPPVTAPGRFADMEVPSLHQHNGKWYMLFAVKEDWYSEEFKREIRPLKAQTGQLYMTADSLDAEFMLDAGNCLLSGADNGLYAGHIVENSLGENVFLGWNMGIEEGFEQQQQPYTLSDPRKVQYLV